MFETSFERRDEDKQAARESCGKEQIPMLMRWALAVLVLILSTNGASAYQAEASIEAVQAYTQGYKAVTAKDWATAIPLLEKAVTLSPEMFVAHFWLGVCNQSQKNIDKALEHYKAFISAATDDPASEQLLQGATRECGVLLAKQKKLDEATPYLEKAVAAKSEDVEARYLLGQALLHAGKKEGAEEQFAKITEINPKSALPFWLAGRLAYDRGDDEAARTRLEGYVVLDSSSPQAAQAHLLLGNLALRAKDSEKALLHFESYLSSNPAGPTADAVRKNVEGLKAGAELAPSTESSAAAEQPEQTEQP
jgi:TolA-binding protein